MSRTAVRVLLGIVLALILIVGGGEAFVWWKISALKAQLVRNLGNAIGAQVEISSLDLDIWKGELHAAGISLTNVRPEAPWTSGDISQVTVRFHLHDILSPTLPVSVEVSSWSILLRVPTAGSNPSLSASSISDSSGADSDSSTGSKGRVQVTQISAQEGTAQLDLPPDNKVVVHGISFQAADNGGGVWNTQLQANAITAGSLQAGQTSVQIRGDEDKINFSDLRMQCDPGAITGDGEVSLDEVHDAKVDLKAVDIPVSMLVAVEWQMKLSGLVSGDLHYTGSVAGGDAKGSMVVNHGKFNVMPMLGKVTALVGLQDISDVEVDKATSDYEWKDHTLHLTNLDIRKNDVTRLSGSVDIDSTGQVDGRIKLGLPSTVTSKWPQLQTAVFPVQSEDYNWADVHVTGTADHLQEDLSSRLLTAGVSSGVNQSTDLINQATQKATDLLNNFMGK